MECYFNSYHYSSIECLQFYNDCLESNSRLFTRAMEWNYRYCNNSMEPFSYNHYNCFYDDNDNSYDDMDSYLDVLKYNLEYDNYNRYNDLEFVGHCNNYSIYHNYDYRNDNLERYLDVLTNVVEHYSYCGN
ncbi:inside tape protein [Staphylococcus phage 80alpha]|uniref:Inside tape protein n=1 Tax=Staphylococcus phage 80alpha TaxID=53369 RepID=A4ZFC3_BP80A|nr:inside tape protein [Staphylococcus phage 80alpha]ABF71628.1 inside tape protein [Staphylococcus phage 80alpha]